MEESTTKKEINKDIDDEKYNKVKIARLYRNDTERGINYSGKIVKNTRLTVFPNKTEGANPAFNMWIWNGLTKKSINTGIAFFHCDIKGIDYSVGLSKGSAWFGLSHNTSNDEKTGKITEVLDMFIIGN